MRKVRVVPHQVELADLRQAGLDERCQRGIEFHMRHVRFRQFDGRARRAWKFQKEVFLPLGCVQY
jgi:hypothetical protein